MTVRVEAGSARFGARNQLDGALGALVSDMLLPPVRVIDRP